MAPWDGSRKQSGCLGARWRGIRDQSSRRNLIRRIWTVGRILIQKQKSNALWLCQIRARQLHRQSSLRLVVSNRSVDWAGNVLLQFRAIHSLGRNGSGKEAAIAVLEKPLA